MKIIKDEKMFKRNAAIGRYTSLGGMAVLGVGMYIVWQEPDQISYAMGSLVLGFVLTQIGMYFGARWGREPRPDQLLEKGLKGLTGEYNLYHYTAPVSHLLVGPAGIWVLRPYLQRNGNLTYAKNRYRLRNIGALQRYMSLFGQEGLGRPDLEAEGDIEAVTRFLHKKLGEDEEIPPVQVALIFCGENVSIELDNEAPYPALPLKKLKQTIRQAAKDSTFDSDILNKIKALLPE